MDFFEFYLLPESFLYIPKYFANKMIVIGELLENFIMSCLSVSVYDVLHCDLIRSVSVDEQLLENTGQKVCFQIYPDECGRSLKDT